MTVPLHWQNKANDKQRSGKEEERQKKKYVLNTSPLAERNDHANIEPIEKIQNRQQTSYLIKSEIRGGDKDARRGVSVISIRRWFFSLNPIYNSIVRITTIYRKKIFKFFCMCFVIV